MSSANGSHDLPPVELAKPSRSMSRGLLIMVLSPVLAFSPFIAGIPLSQLLCEQPANEGNCSWVALGWFGLLTIPAGFIMFFVGLIVMIASAVSKKN